MTLTGLASENASSRETMFALFIVSSVCYINTFVFIFIKYITYKKQLKRDTNFPSQLTDNELIIFKILFYMYALIWNGYPITFILYKTRVIPIENAIISFACLDFISKGACILTILAYNLLLHERNGYLVSAFRRIIRIHPVNNDLTSISIEAGAKLNALEDVNLRTKECQPECQRS
jgi:bacteriorhodopsin